MNTAREVLDSIDEFLVNGPTDETKKLWDVLSALRGPDNESDNAKEHQTIPIRRAAFPLHAAGAQEVLVNGYRDVGPGYYKTSALFGSSESRWMHPEYSGPNYVSHFAHHAKSAALALGLE